MHQHNSIVSGRYPAIGDHRGWMLRGFRDGFPIAMGYFAVSFALGIAARNVGMNAVQGFLMSLGMVASAGEYAAIMLIGAGAGVLEMIATTVVINLRYFLMSCSLTQKLDPKTPLWKRFRCPIPGTQLTARMAATIITAAPAGTRGSCPQRKQRGTAYSWN